MTVQYQPHTLIEFGGTITGVSQNDIWTCGLRIVGFNELGPLVDPASYMNAIQANLSSWWASTTRVPRMPSTATLDWLKVNNIGADGKYSDKTNTNRHDYTPVPGGGTATMPGFCAVVGTWETANRRGLAHRGRMYLPLTTAALQSGSEMSNSTRDQCVSVYASLYSTLVTHFNTGANRAQGIIASSKNAAWNQITGVSCDSVIDVQRRRKNAIKGSRSAVTAVSAS